jgi:shikimate dehydrogenase
VTIPHKQTVIPYLDELTPTAQAIGAVNTIFRSDDFSRLIGDNTDAPGFLADLWASFPHLCRDSLVKGFGLKVDSPILQLSTFNQRHALVLGAGGSARAVVYALLQDGWNITLYARRPEQAVALATHFSPFIKPSQSLTIQHSLFTIDHSLLINTTPLGMTPSLDTSPWPADLPFPEHAAVYDLVYNPRETKLVRDARDAGLPATTGLGMLIEQAALAFEIWTGTGADREGMRNAVR